MSQRRSGHIEVDAFNHYLGHRVPVGANLRYVVRSERSGEQVLACLLWSSPAWRMAPRDQWIGGKQEQRAQNLQLVVNKVAVAEFPVTRKLPCALP